MEIFASYIPVVLIVLAIIAGYWRTTVQYGDLGIKYGNIMANMATQEDIRDLKNIVANMATKEDIRDIKEEFRYMRDEMKDIRNDIRALDDRMNRFEMP